MTFPTEAQAQEFLRQMVGITEAQRGAAVVISTTHGHWVITDPTEAKRPAKICAICHEPFREFGCNPRPITSGDCCAYCDDHVVTPARIIIAQEKGL